MGVDGEQGLTLERVDRALAAGREQGISLDHEVALWIARAELLGVSVRTETLVFVTGRPVGEVRDALARLSEAGLVDHAVEAEGSV